MTRDEIAFIIREELRRILPGILAAKTEGTTDTGKESFSGLYGDATTVNDRPVMHPFGIKSRAPNGTTALITTQGHSTDNRIILGHRDYDAPKVDAEGDVVLYEASGKEIYLKNGKIAIGSRNAGKGAARNGDMVQIDSGATVVGTIVGPGPPGGPVNSGSTVSITLSAPLTPGKIISGSNSVTIDD